MASRVRAATPADARAIAEVQVTTWRVAYRGLVPQDYLTALSTAAAESAWAARIAAGNDVLVSPPHAAPRGFVSFGETLDRVAGRPIGEIFALYVLPHLWGTGAGRALHDAAVERLADRDRATAVLWVLASNRRARAFYERQGWGPDGGERTEALGEATRLREVRYRRVHPPW